MNPGGESSPAAPPRSHPPPPPLLHISSAPDYLFTPSSQYGSHPETAKKKRGRPRKYSPDSFGGVRGGEGNATVTETTPKRKGRPPGSGKKQYLDGSFGASFTPHIITVNPGEDIASKILAFSQHGPRTVCILSANGAVSNVTLRQPTVSGSTMTYEGRYEIISLSGSYLLSESNGSRSRTGGVSVSLAGPDGQVLGGGIAGVMRAAVPVQVIVGTFIAGGRKPKPGPSSPPPPTNMLNFTEPLTVASPPSQTHSTDSEEEHVNGHGHGSGSATYNGGPLFYNENNNNVSQAFHGTPMHQNMVWSTSTSHMLPQ